MRVSYEREPSNFSYFVNMTDMKNWLSKGNAIHPKSERQSQFDFGVASRYKPHVTYNTHRISAADQNSQENQDQVELREIPTLPNVSNDHPNESSEKLEEVEELVNV